MSENKRLIKETQMFVFAKILQFPSLLERGKQMLFIVCNTLLGVILPLPKEKY